MELLSPAGDFEALKTAVQCGADAVYLGGKAFSARKNANNFTNEEIKAAVDFCHLYQVKVYVTLNVLIKEGELSKALDFASYLIEIGVDGIIVQDLGLLGNIRRLSPEVFINASTQMTVCNSHGVNLLESLGVNRVVLARELSKKEIENIREKTNIELEMFVHGAMCMSWSGQCLLSSFIGARSGNRGLCAQPCRLSYKLLKDNKAVTEMRPLLCMKDLCLAEEITTLKEMVDSAKIEGRMKSAEYTGVVTKVYKKAKDGNVEKTQINDMLSFFSRGGSGKGYFYGRTFQDAMDYAPAEKVTATKASIQEIKQTQTEKKRKISFTLFAKEGEKLKLSAQCDAFTQEVFGEVCEKANHAMPDEERIKTQLAKLGDTPFAPGDMGIIVEGQPFLSVSAVNQLRRQVCEKIEESICASYRRKVNTITIGHTPGDSVPKPPEICVQVRTEEQLKAAEDFGIQTKYLSYDLFLKYGTEKDVCVLPSVTKEGEKLSLEKAKRVMVQNIGQIPMAEGKILYGGERLNVTNSETVKKLNALGVKRVTLSTELNIREIKHTASATKTPTELILYGRLPVMLMENCVIKSAYHCTKGQGNFALQDRMGEQFPLICEGCRNVLLNSVPLYMADKMADLSGLNVWAYRLLFTTETYAECKKVMEAYRTGMEKGVPHKVFEKITRGHFYRGVE